MNWFEEAYKMETRKQRLYIATVFVVPVVALGFVATEVVSPGGC